MLERFTRRSAVQDAGALRRIGRDCSENDKKGSQYDVTINGMFGRKRPCDARSSWRTWQLGTRIRDRAQRKREGIAFRDHTLLKAGIIGGTWHALSHKLGRARGRRQ